LYYFIIIIIIIISILSASLSLLLLSFLFLFIILFYFIIIIFSLSSLLSFIFKIFDLILSDWISFLVYLNLFEIKGFIVVVIDKHVTNIGREMNH
jgi:hypothetical protein